MLDGKHPEMGNDGEIPENQFFFKDMILESMSIYDSNQEMINIPDEFFMSFSMCTGGS